MSRRSKHSWVGTELYGVRNIRPSLPFRDVGGAHALSTRYVRVPRAGAVDVASSHADNTTLKLAKDAKKIAYPAPDGVVSFDRLSSVYLSNTNHEED